MFSTVAISPSCVYTSRVRQRRSCGRLIAYSDRSGQKGEGGIHDGFGVGQSEKFVKTQQAPIDAQRMANEQKIQQGPGPLGGNTPTIDREAAAEKELLEIAAEKEEEAKKDAGSVKE